MTVELRSRGAVAELLEQHAQQAAFLWVLRERSLDRATLDLRVLSELDERIDAHLAALRLGGERAWEIARDESVRWREPGEVFVAAQLAFSSDERTRAETIHELAAGSRELARPVASALGWLQLENAARHIDALLSSESATLRRVGVAAAVAHRCDPGAALISALEADDASLRARALRAVGELGRLDLLEAVRLQLEAKDAEPRFEAAWTLALRGGDGAAVEELKRITERAAPEAGRALQVASRRLEPGEARRWIQRLATDSRTSRLAVLAAAASGDPASAPWLIEAMTQPALARIAGSAFHQITGLDLTRDDFRADPPHGHVGGPNDNPADRDISLDPDEGLPWPEPDAVARWWLANGSRFQIGSRALLGRAIRRDWLLQVLQHGRQPERAAAALDLVAVVRSEPLFELRGPAARQQRMLLEFLWPALHAFTAWR